MLRGSGCGTALVVTLALVFAGRAEAQSAEGQGAGALAEMIAAFSKRQPKAVVEMAPSNVIVANFARYKGRYVRLQDRELEIAVKVGDANTPLDEMDAAAIQALRAGFRQTEFDGEMGLFALVYPFPVTNKREKVSCDSEEHPDGCHWITSGTFDLFARIDSLQQAVNKLGMTIRVPVLQVVAAWDGKVLHATREMQKYAGAVVATPTPVSTLNTVEEAEAFARGRGLTLSDRSEGTALLAALPDYYKKAAIQSFQYNAGPVAVAIVQFHSGHAAEKCGSMFQGTSVVNGRVVFVVTGDASGQQRVSQLLR